MVRDWEVDSTPKSLVVLNKEFGAHLRAYREVAQCDLFWNVAQCSGFLWAMDEDCHIRLAYEEIVVDIDPAEVPGLKEGYPRRRGFPIHPADEKKLGHPTLVGRGSARVAGELFLDVVEQKLHWFVNCQSGRYCGDPGLRPSPPQCEAAHDLFKELIDAEVLFDDLRR